MQLFEHFLVVTMVLDDFFYCINALCQQEALCSDSVYLMRGNLTWFDFLSRRKPVAQSGAKYSECGGGGVAGCSNSSKEMQSCAKKRNRTAQAHAEVERPRLQTVQAERDG